MRKYTYPSEVIIDLENTQSRNNKEKILEQAWNDGLYSLFEGLKLCYDPLRTFFAKKIPYIEDEDDEGDSSYTFNHFKDMVQKLETRKASGNVARDLLHDAALTAPTKEWNYFYRRILLKDMKCGVSEKTINKVLKKIGKKDKEALSYIIDIFEVQLAENTDIDNCHGEVLIDPKYDGVRLIAILDKTTNSVTMFTRNGRQNNNFQYVIQNLESLLEDIPWSFVLDGEIISENFNQLMKQVNRKKDIDTKDAIFMLFDILPLEDFHNKKCEKPLYERHEALIALESYLKEKCFVEYEDSIQQNVCIIPKLETNLDTEDGKKKLSEFNAEILSRRNNSEEYLEGVMVKDKYSPYERKRTKSWKKIKPTVDVTLEIEDIEEGTGRNKNRLGNFICKGYDLGHYIHVSVGSGFSDEQREEFWQRKNELLGSLVEIRADDISLDEDSETSYSLRFPRFICFRELDKNEGKI